MPGTWWDMYDTQLLHSTAHPSGNVGSKKIDTVDPRPSTVGRDLPDPLQSTHPWWLSGARVSHSSCDNISSPAARTVALATSFLIDTTYNLQPRRAPQSPPPPPPNAFFFFLLSLFFFAVVGFAFRPLLFLSSSVCPFVVCCSFRLQLLLFLFCSPWIFCAFCFSFLSSVLLRLLWFALRLLFRLVSSTLLCALCFTLDPFSVFFSHRFSSYPPNPFAGQTALRGNGLRRRKRDDVPTEDVPRLQGAEEARTG